MPSKNKNEGLPLPKKEHSNRNSREGSLSDPNPLYGGVLIYEELLYGLNERGK